VGAGFRSLKDSWADTTSPHGRLMLTVLGGLAEFERELIRARTGEGRKRAKERGVRFGRPRKLTPHQREEALRRLAAGETAGGRGQDLQCRSDNHRPPAAIIGAGSGAECCGRWLAAAKMVYSEFKNLCVLEQR